MFRPISFKKFLQGYEKEYNRELDEWHKQNPNFKATTPEGLDEQIIRQYTAYQNYLQSRNLIIVTWVLAVATIILSVLTLILN